MRRNSRQIHVGSVAVGGSAPVSIQTMAKADPQDVDTIVEQLLEAKTAGCDIARVAVPDLAAAERIPEIRERSQLPIVADVHFDHELAVAAARLGADALRVNPGNLGGKEALLKVVEAAGSAQIPIRVGVNGGSLSKKALNSTSSMVEAMLLSARAMVAEVEETGFKQLKVSLKAFDVSTTVEVCRLFATESDLPLHLGVTEAGPPLAGSVRSAAALSQLLAAGIGDTIRISLSAPPVVEVRVARQLLSALGLRRSAVLVSCPTCGRTSVDLISIAERVERRLEELNLDSIVAVMGCEVNGPGEAKIANLGIAFGSRGRGSMFEAGRVVARMANSELESALLDRLTAMGKKQP